MKKKLLSMLLCLCMVITLLPTVALAAAGDTFLAQITVGGEQVECIFKILTDPEGDNPGTVQVGNGTSSAIAETSAGALTIPANVTSGGKTYTVTSIGHLAFYHCSGLTGSLSIPSGVTSIGQTAFAGCTGLTGSLSIPSGITSIDTAAFRDCTGLTSVTIPNSVTSIGGYAFDGCSKLTALTVDAANSSFSAQDNILYDKNKTTLLCCPAGLTGTVTIPSGVTSIADAAFRYCSGLTSVAIPSSVKTISDYAFEKCSGLTGALIIPSGVTSIGCNAFFECKKLTSVTIPNSVKTIGQNAFHSCSELTSVTIPDSVTSIGGYAFAYCSNLTSAEFNGTTAPQMGDNVFYYPASSFSITVPTGEGVSGYRDNNSTNGWQSYAAKIAKKDGPEAPAGLSFSFDGTNAGKLMGATDLMEYSLDRGKNWTDCTADMALTVANITAENDIQVRVKETDDTKAGTVKTFDITKATTPAAGKTNCTTLANNDGTLTGVTALMEYQKSGAGSWTTGTSDGTITNLAAGIYYVRVKATGTVLASDNQTLTIDDYVAATDKAITAFSIGGNNGVIDESGHTIAVTVPYYGTNVTSLTPTTITVSDKATVSPQSGTAKDFTNPVTYTVTAENGSTQTYTVTVTVTDPKLTSVTAPSEQTLASFCDDAAAACAALRTAVPTVTITAENKATTLPCVWSYTGGTYDKAANATNSFHWEATTTNYDVNGKTVSGDVTITNRAAEQLTITAPTFTGKTYDGTTNATSTVTLGTVSGKLNGSDTVNVTVTSATYDNPNAGTGKTITVVYAIDGKDAWKYIKPVNSTSATGIITPKPLTLASATATNRDYASGDTAVAISAVTFN